MQIRTNIVIEYYRSVCSADKRSFKFYGSSFSVFVPNESFLDKMFKLLPEYPNSDAEAEDEDETFNE